MAWNSYDYFDTNVTEELWTGEKISLGKAVSALIPAHGVRLYELV